MSVKDRNFHLRAWSTSSLPNSVPPPHGSESWSGANFRPSRAEAGTLDLAASLRARRRRSRELMGSEEYGQGWASAGSAKISRFPEDFTLLLTDDRPRHANPTSQFVRAQCFEEVS